MVFFPSLKSPKPVMTLVVISEVVIKLLLKDFLAPSFWLSCFAKCCSLPFEGVLPFLFSVKADVTSMIKQRYTAVY